MQTTSEDDTLTSEIPLEVAIAFVNTLEHSRDHDTEHLPDGGSLVAWLTDHALLERGRLAGGRSGKEAERALRDARSLRRALRAAIDARVAGRTFEARDIEVVNRWLRRRAALRLVDGPDGLALQTHAGDDAFAAALSRIAEAAARGIVGDDPGRLRVCANDECRWVYYDTSRGGQRKWCDMAVCGNRAKARRHRQRASVAQGGKG